MKACKFSNRDAAVCVIILLMLIYIGVVGAPSPYIPAGLGLLAVMILVGKNERQK